MKRWIYFGGWPDIEGALFLPIVIIVSIFLACAALTSGNVAVKITMFALCILVCFGSGYDIWKYRNVFYAWGSFQKDAVYVKVLFDKVFPIYYEKCKSIGIGVYVDGFTSKEVGFRHLYIFFSYDPFNEKYRASINEVKRSHTFVTIGYSKKVYEHLLTVLPQYHAATLRHDYEMIQRYKQEAKAENKKQKRRKKKRKK